MLIKTRLSVSALFFILMFFVVGTIILITFQQINKESAKKVIADSLVKGVFELNILIHDYLLYQSKRSQTQLQQRFDSLNALLLKLEFQDPEEKVFVNRMQKSHQAIKKLFSRLMSVSQNPDYDRKNVLSQQLKDSIVNRLLIKSQEMVSDVFLLNKESHQDFFSIQKMAKLLIMGLLVLLAVLTVANSLWITRSIVKPITRLQEGAEVVGTGNFDFKVGIDTKDEIGQLSMSFDRMSKNLKTVTASQDELEREITERNRTQEALLESEERFRSTFELAPVGITHVAPDGRFLRINQRYCDIVGYTQEEMLTRTFQDITYPDDLEIDLAYVQQMLAGKIQNYSMEKRYIRKDDSLVWVNLTVALMRDPSGGPNYFISAVEDITQRKREQGETQRLNEELKRWGGELKAVNEELKAFSYSVSHDLRAPLRSIDGFSQALLEDHTDQLDAEGKDYLQRVRAASQNMGQLIDDLLKLSRVTRRGLQSTTVDMSALAQEIATGLQETAPERKAEFVITPQLVVHADANLLRVMLENLLGNAWKFTRNRSGVKIEFGVTQNEGETAYFVSDNGAGFDMAYADKLFGAFQRLHQKSEFEGTGIGLATVQRIIRRHGGQVWAEGAVDQGATFYFTLAS